MKQEWTHRTPPSGHTASDIGSRGVHTFEGREAFLSQPLATSEEEVDVEQGVRGAAYARSNNNRSNGGRERKESSSDEEVSLDFQTISTIRRSQEAMERPAAPASTTTTSDNHASQSENAKAKGRGAAIMRNHEAQRFASARPVALTVRAAPVVSSGSNSPSRNSPQNTDRVQPSAGQSNFEEVEEADL